MMSFRNLFGKGGDPAGVELSLRGTVLTVSGKGHLSTSGCQFCILPDKVRSKVRSVVIGEGFTRIGQYYFCHCANIESVVIPDTVESIGGSAFFGCEGLRRLVIPRSVTRIGKYAFGDCRGLESVVIPNSVTSIGRRAFYGLKGLKEIVVPDDEPLHFDEVDGIDLTASPLLETVRGNTVSCPEYIVSHTAKDFRDKLRGTFSDFAGTRIEDALDKWAEKREFETTEQWRQRVSDSAREAQRKFLNEKMRKDFIGRMAPATLGGTPGTYDADSQTLPIVLDDKTEIRIRVPLAEAEDFKTRWSEVEAHPTYDIVGDRLALVACTFTLDGKSYAMLAE